MFKLPPGLVEATRLTRAGRLGEATALIQRVLGGQRAESPPAPAAPTANEVIQGEYRVVEVEAPSRPSSPRGEPSSAKFIDGSYSNAAGTRRYKLYVPSGHGREPLPLLVMLHGCTQGADDFARGTRMNAVAEEMRCLVLYPEQSRRANGQRCWNWFNKSDQGRERGEPALLAGMTEEIVRTYGADRSRVYVAGLSAGGAMAAVMARTHPDLYAAACVHSGIAYAIAHDVPSAFAAMREPGPRSTRLADSAVPPVPTIVFHGDRDEVVHPDNAGHVVAQSAAAHAIDPHAHSDAGVSVTEGRVPGGRAYTCTTYRDADGRPVLENWTIHGAGHAWSGGSAEGTYTDPKGPDASREMMRFFAASRAATR